MSCSGCRVLRKGCSESCVLRSCLHWIDSPEAQGNATLFLAKFFGRSDLLSFISAVPDHQKPDLFQSLLYEACGRTVNPVNGAVGLLSSGNWHLCQAAMETVLSGGVLRPIPGIESGALIPIVDESSLILNNETCMPRKRQNLYFPSTPSIFDARGYHYQLPDKEISLPLNLGSKNKTGTRRSVPVEKRRRDAISLNSDESGTSFESGGMAECEERKLLNLFV